MEHAIEHQEAWKRLDRMPKETLIHEYMLGVVQPNGHVLCSAGPARELRKWRKEELVSSLLEIGWR